MTSGLRYELLPSFLIGFHGTDQNTAKKILAGSSHLSQSQNDYDWLGHGTYFWEYSPLRAEQFIREKLKWQGRKEKIAVLGAIIAPGLCQNLLDAKGLSLLQVGYDALLTVCGGEEFLPKNGDGKELWKRKLDCAVINMVHELRAVTRSPDWRLAHPDTTPLPTYDTVRGAFWEGGPIYPGARIEKKNHVQICVRNSANTIAYFRPIPDD